MIKFMNIFIDTLCSMTNIVSKILLVYILFNDVSTDQILIAFSFYVMLIGVYNLALFSESFKAFQATIILKRIDKLDMQQIKNRYDSVIRVARMSSVVILFEWMMWSIMIVSLFPSGMPWFIVPAFAILYVFLLVARLRILKKQVYLDMVASSFKIKELKSGSKEKVGVLTV